MRIFVELDNGLLPDRFGKHAPETCPKARARLRSRFSTTTPSP